jgi:hypothetical protein
VKFLCKFISNSEKSEIIDSDLLGSSIDVWAEKIKYRLFLNYENELSEEELSFDSRIELKFSKIASSLIKLLIIDHQINKDKSGYRNEYFIMAYIISCLCNKNMAELTGPDYPYFGDFDDPIIEAIKLKNSVVVKSALLCDAIHREKAARYLAVLAQYGFASVIEYLISSIGHILDIEVYFEATIYAIEYRHFELAQYFIQTKGFALSDCDILCNLNEAIILDDIGMFNEIIEKGCSVNDFNIGECNELYSFLEKCISKEKFDKLLTSPVRLAVQYGRIEMVKQIINSGYVLEPEQHNELIQLTIDNRHFDLALLLFDRGLRCDSITIKNSSNLYRPDINIRGSSEETFRRLPLCFPREDQQRIIAYMEPLLHQFARLNNLDMVEYLLDLGVSIELLNKDNKKAKELVKPGTSIYLALGGSRIIKEISSGEDSVLLEDADPELSRLLIVGDFTKKVVNDRKLLKNLELGRRCASL